jgi:hypothetical protein
MPMKLGIHSAEPGEECGRGFANNSARRSLQRYSEEEDHMQSKCIVNHREVIAGCSSYAWLRSA